MSLLSVFLNHVLENWEPLAFIVLGLAFGLVGVQTFYGWYRLRYIKGPFLASFSKIWLIRAVSGGEMHWEFARVNQKYGTYHILFVFWDR